MKKIKRILIANRGEIALRVMNTAHQMGIETVAIYTEGEETLLHKKRANYSVFLGSGALSETYLNINKIISICKEYDVDAIHPGYGFLSENAEFAKKTQENGIVFIGPSTDAIVLMGDKKASKEKIQEIGVPSIPGFHGEDQSEEKLKEEAFKIGYPVLIKATAGGGGKGMRVVESEGEFSEALNSAKREALNSFGNDFVLLEKYIKNPRHIEIQVLSDSHGNHIHLFERECSIQRRHQKVLEETPSVALSEEKRVEIAECATKITKAINYLGAGTVEFLLDEDGQFYFLEMNTRLQVEHPITEMVYGVDLVKEQILVAEGKKISFDFKDIKRNGHAIELRIYAENPDEGFLPSVGKILKVGEPTESGVRLDSGYFDGDEVTIDFDPMLAKLIIWGKNRNEAILKAKRAIDEVPFFGVITNRSYLYRVLDSNAFVEGETFTHFVETNELSLSQKIDIPEPFIASAFYLFQKSQGQSKQMNSTWNEIKSFRLVEEKI